MSFFTARSDIRWVQMALRYASFSFAFVLCRTALKSLIRLRLIRFLFWISLAGLFCWARFREPNHIQVKHTTIQAGFTKRIALISDLHLGVYKDETFLLDVVSRINAQTGIDMVLIAGDFTFLPGNKNLDILYSPLGLVKVPVYAVLGNHDEQKPGPNVKLPLIHALEKRGVRYLENDAVDLIDMVLIGLGDRDAGLDDIRILDRFSPETHVVVLTHQPDTVRGYTNTVADVTLVGHTHCGQIRIPHIYKYMIPTQGSIAEKFDCGLSILGKTKLYISAGLGEDLLPMRFLNPPTIDIIDIVK